MSDKKHILILARTDIFLCCSGLAELLSREREFCVDLVNEESREFSDGRHRNHHHLAVYFAEYSAPTRTSKISSLCGNDTKILLILGSEDKFALNHLRRQDVAGVVSSSSPYAELLTAINALVIKNLKYISPLLVGSLVAAPLQNVLSCLSRKELDIALFVTHGRRNVEIATELNISPKTVHTYKSRIYKKLGISNNMQLMKMALRLGNGMN